MLKTKVKEETDFGRLLREGDYLKKIPAVGDTVHGMIISTNRREVCVDIEGVTGIAHWDENMGEDEK